MRKRLEVMISLAQEICDEEKRKADVKGVLLFGSVANGSVHPESDLDIVVIRPRQTEPIRRNRHERNGIIVDMWEHSLLNYESFFRRDWAPSEMFLYSLS